MIPKKVKDHLEEYISQEIYVQIAVIKGKEKISTQLAINNFKNFFKLRFMAEKCNCKVCRSKYEREKTSRKRG